MGNCPPSPPPVYAHSFCQQDKLADTIKLIPKPEYNHQRQDHLDSPTEYYRNVYAMACDCFDGFKDEDERTRCKDVQAVKQKRYDGMLVRPDLTLTAYPLIRSAWKCSRYYASDNYYIYPKECSRGWMEYEQRVIPKLNDFN